MRRDEPTFCGGVVKFNDVEGLGLKPWARVAFAGRSNVGKSSLLNALTHSQMARVSQEPGKTREMNFYQWNRFGEDFYLVDLPGYGFAKVKRDLKSEWGKEIGNWIKKDHYLAVVMVLVDGRHGFFDQDRELIEYLVKVRKSFAVVFTKMDKWKSHNQQKSAESSLGAFCKELGVEHYCFCSSIDKHGVAPLEKLLGKIILG